MKKLIITCAILAWGSAASFAQTQQTTTMVPQQGAASSKASQVSPTVRQVQVEQIAERRAKIYQQEYGLNAEQYKKSYDAELEYMKEQMHFRQENKQPSQEDVTRLNMIKDQKYKAFLNKDQYQKYISASNRQPMQPAMHPQKDPGAK